MMLPFLLPFAFACGVLDGEAARDRAYDFPPVPMVLIDDQLHARPIGLLRLSAPADGRKGEIVFLDSKLGAPAANANARTTLSTDQVLALALPGWIVDPLSSHPPAPAVIPAKANTPAAPGKPKPNAMAPDPKPMQPSEGPQLPTVSPPPLTGFRAWIELTDGQRLPGAPARVVDDADKPPKAAPDGQTLLWLHNRLGMMHLPMDSISRVVLQPSGASSASNTSSDLVILANGDRITGFVDSITESVVISPPKPIVKAGQPKPAPVEPSTVPLDQIAEIRLSNPPQPMRGGVAWLNDGSVIASSRVEIGVAERRVTLIGAAATTAKTGDPAQTRAAPGASFDVAELRALSPDARRLIPLSSVPIAGQQAAQGRSFEPVVVAPTSPMLGSDLGADDLVLPGPMTVMWTLPAGASHVSAYLVLEERSWAWGDCEVTVAITAPDGTERTLSRSRLNAANPVAPINGEVAPKSTLRISIDPGEHGAIQDRIVIRHGLVKVEPGAK